MTTAASKGAQATTEAPKGGEQTPPAGGTKTGEAPAGATTKTGEGDGTGGAGATTTKKEGGDQGAATGDGTTKDDKSGGAAGAKKVPDKYELKVPDDAKDSIGKEELDYLEQVARASEWSNEDAQSELEAAIERQRAAIKRRHDAWITETKADEDFGGDQLAETERLGNAAIDKVFPTGHRLREGFLAFLKGSGATNKLEVAAFLATIGRLMGEDRPVTRRQPAKPAGGENLDSFYDAPSSKKVQEESTRAQ
jgi:hypothetical protein